MKLSDAVEHGDFFAIDHRAWMEVCRLGLNPAIAYLVIARGTGGDNRTSFWSVHAIEQRTGISRPRAKTAVNDLVTSGLVDVETNTLRPQYYLTPGHEVAIAALEALNPDEKAVLAAVAAGERVVPKLARNSGEPWRCPRPFAIACALARRRMLLRHDNGQHFSLPSEAKDPAEPQWIWLPNALVDGVGSDPPIEVIRQGQDVAALQLLIELYHHHALTTDGGLAWQRGRGIRQNFERFELGSCGPFTVWVFREGNVEVATHTPITQPYRSDKDRETMPQFNQAWGALVQLRLIEMVPHLVESDSLEGEVIHALPFRNGELSEFEITRAAVRAAAEMVNAAGLVSATAGKFDVAAPVNSHLRNVQLVGIARLRYRPKTRATAAWHAESGGSEWITNYEDWSERAKRLTSNATSR